MERLNLNRSIVRYTGLYDMDGLYALIIGWCKDKGYIWHEETYKHKVPSPRGAEQEWGWWIEKEITEYIKFEVHFHPHAWEINEVEIDKGGKKKSLINGKFEIIIQPIMILDWQKKWDKNRFTRFLGKRYYELMRKEIESLYHDMLYYRVWNLQALIKKFFDMQAKWHTYKTYLKEN